MSYKNIYASFSDAHMAEKAGGALLDYGVTADDMSIVFPEGYGSPRDEATGGNSLEVAAKTGISTTTAADAASGSAKGAGIGLAAGALAALAAVFIPGVGLVIGGGALALAAAGLAGTTVAGAIAGGATGFLKDQGLPEHIVESYREVVGSGGAIITVSPVGESVDINTIESVIRKYGGSITTFPMVDPVTTAIVIEEEPTTVIIEKI